MKIFLKKKLKKTSALSAFDLQHPPASFKVLEKSFEQKNCELTCCHTGKSCLIGPFLLKVGGPNTSKLKQRYQVTSFSGFLIIDAEVLEQSKYTFS